jgi:hypothetical protein
MLISLLAWLVRLSAWSGRRHRARDGRAAPVRRRANSPQCVVQSEYGDSAGFGDLAVVALANYVALICLAILTAALMRIDPDWRPLGSVSEPAPRQDSLRGPPRWPPH